MEETFYRNEISLHGNVGNWRQDNQLIQVEFHPSFQVVS